MCCLHALQICKALHVSVQEHALIEQALANVLALRSVGGEALANRLKQLQAVGAEPFLAGCVCVCLNGPTCWNALGVFPAPVCIAFLGKPCHPADCKRGARGAQRSLVAARLCCPPAGLLGAPGRRGRRAPFHLHCCQWYEPPEVFLSRCAPLAGLQGAPGRGGGDHPARCCLCSLCRELVWGATALNFLRSRICGMRLVGRYCIHVGAAEVSWGVRSGATTGCQSRGCTQAALVLSTLSPSAGGGAGAGSPVQGRQAGSAHRATAGGRPGAGW